MSQKDSNRIAIIAAIRTPYVRVGTVSKYYSPLEFAIGRVNKQKLNLLCSSMEIEHPFTATGIRITTALTNEMKRRNARLGLISICGTGGTAATMIIEREI